MGLKRYVARLIRAIKNQSLETYFVDNKYILNPTYRRFESKVVLITGASGEIGGEIAKRLAIEGGCVYLGGRNVQKLDAFVKEITMCSGEAHAISVDVSDEESIRNCVDIIVKEKGKIDILVNCAGGSTRNNCADLLDQKIEMIDEMLNVNLRGSILFTREVGKVMRSNFYGRIVNISSVIGEHGKAKFSDYAASKAGIIGYTKSVAQELGKFGITVNCVSPGIVQRGGIDEEMLPYLLRTNFLNRVGKATDISAAVAFIASDDASFITGQNLCVDGGRSLGLHGD